MATLDKHLKEQINIFTEHPRSVGETYNQHFKFAIKASLKLARASLCCFIHAFAPFVFTNTASGIVKSLNRKLESRVNNDYFAINMAKMKHPTSHRRNKTLI